MQQSQYACHGSNGKMVWWVWGEGATEEKRRGRGSTTSHSLTHVPLAACVCMCGMQVEEDMGCW